MILFNKKGFSDVTSIVFFIAAFAVVAVVIGGSILIFYAHEIDIRLQDAEALNEKIVEGIRLDGLSDIENFEIYSTASIDKNVINNDFFYFKISFFENGEEVRESIIEGNRDYAVNCDLPGDKLPQCSKSSINVGRYNVRIVTGSNYRGSKL